MASDTSRRMVATGSIDENIWKEAGSAQADNGETAVPEAPPTSTTSTRKLGPASLSGTLCADPVLRFAGSGNALVKVRLATSKRHRDPETGNYSNGPTEFIDVTVWGRQGENVMECLRKGDRVVVNGAWMEATWRGQDNAEHVTRSVTAADIGPSLLFRQASVVRAKEGS